jgi:16S rRNA (cytosine1402-N4)-methyltransferase
MAHTPVLPRETLELSAAREGILAVDVTAGGGGHLSLLVEAVGPIGRVIALDRDPRAHEPSAAGGVAAQFSDRVTLVRAAFSELEEVLAAQGVEGGVDLVLADLGVSSMQLDEAERGFSLRHDGPLDMRMDPERGESAWEMLDRLDENEIADVLYLYGEERRSRRIARAIKRAWPLKDSTLALADVIAPAAGGRRGRIHPATKSFQGLRIAVNRELEELDSLLAALPRVLRPGGRAAVISFHSLEDRKVKRAFQEGGRREDPIYSIITKRPVIASEEEQASNPRSRSAKLRVVERKAP